MVISLSHLDLVSTSLPQTKLMLSSGELIGSWLICTLSKDLAFMAVLCSGKHMFGQLV